tara:strand:- start:72 stop:248 length:177 start_codon:yes stop_codon:yes gene_type:complete
VDKQHDDALGCGDVDEALGDELGDALGEALGEELGDEDALEEEVDGSAPSTETTYPVT